MIFDTQSLPGNGRYNRQRLSVGLSCVTGYGGDIDLPFTSVHSGGSLADCVTACCVPPSVIYLTTTLPGFCQFQKALGISMS